MDGGLNSPAASPEELLNEQLQQNEGGPSQDDPISLRNLVILPDPTVESIRPIKAAELKALSEGQTALAFAGDISTATLRTSHHAVARDIADGMELVNVSRTYGLHMDTLRLLIDAPAFVELVQSYTNRPPGEVKFDLRTKIEALAHDSMDEIRSRLDTRPDKFSTGQLMGLAGDMLDRAGHSKVHRSVNLNGGLDAAALKRIKSGEPVLGGSTQVALQGEAEPEGL